MKYKREEEEAVAAVMEAVGLCTAVRKELLDPSTLEKEDRSPVTLADFGSQALICRRLQMAFSRDPVVAEEDAGALRSPENEGMLNRIVGYVQRSQPHADAEAVSDWIDAGNGEMADRFWTLDPIDGTKGFLRNDQYAVALALVEDGEVKLGVLGCPALSYRPDAEPGVLFVAQRDRPAERVPIRGGGRVHIQVAKERGGPSWRMLESVESSHGNSELHQQIAGAIGLQEPSLRMDSQAKYGAVASGEAVLYLRMPSPKQPDYREKVWDHAAGSLVVEAAGGKVTDMFCRPLDFGSSVRMEGNRGVVVSNGHVHDAVIEALSKTVVVEEEG